MSLLGERIINLRNKAGLSQALLAYECDWDKGRVSNYENGHRVPKLSDLEIIANVLDGYLEPHSIVYLVSGFTVSELANKELKPRKNKFTPEVAVAAFKNILSDAIELGFLRTRPGFKVEELIKHFSKKCGDFSKNASVIKKKA